jgi:uncharacterized membrane protein
MAVARKSSQVVTHLAIGFALTYALTGSMMLGGLAVLIEPLLNVMLVPFHEKAWEHKLKRAVGQRRIWLVGAEKVSLTVLHMGVAFLVMYFATGSMAFGGLVAILEPVCNVVLMPVHDKLWNQLQAGRGMQAA